VNSKIIFIQSLEIFSDQEHLLTICEDSLEIFKVQRKAKINNIQYHDSEIIKLFVTEPVKVDNKIKEDAK
jgi:hypothetical protein